MSLTIISTKCYTIIENFYNWVLEWFLNFIYDVKETIETVQNIYEIISPILTINNIFYIWVLEIILPKRLKIIFRLYLLIYLILCKSFML